MQDILAFFEREAFKFSGQSITWGDVVLVPAVAIVGLLFAGWLVRFVSRRLVARGTDADLVQLVRRILYIAIFAALAMTILDLIRVPLTAFAFVSGAIAIGVGFGAQNIINNFISGWILMWERPIRIGDFLEVDGTTGTVEAINTRSTRIRRVDGVHLLVPNSKLLENTVVNWTLVDANTRTVVRVGVAYGSPVRKTADLIMQAVREQKGVLEDPAPRVFFEDFGDSSLVFEAFFWIEAKGERDLRTLRSDVRFRIDELFHEAGIVISFPQRDVHIDGALEITRRRDAQGD